MSAFSDYVNQAARSAGYDLSGPRSGGRKALAEAAGMGQTAVGRMLAGACLPDPYALPKLATALSVPVEDLLRLVGLLPVGESNRPAPRTRVLTQAFTGVPPHLTIRLEFGPEYTTGGIQAITDRVRVASRHGLVEVTEGGEPRG